MYEHRVREMGKLRHRTVTELAGATQEAGPAL